MYSIVNLPDFIFAARPQSYVHGHVSFIIILQNQKIKSLYEFWKNVQNIRNLLRFSFDMFGENHDIVPVPVLGLTYVSCYGNFKKIKRETFREKPMATIKEIAALAGVSRGTVDRVLNHRGSVNPKTAEKILEIARALDYKPNKAGIVLAAQKRKLKLGVILLGAGNPFYEEVLLGISAKAAELAGYNCTVLIRQTEYSLKEQLLAIDELAEEGINGLALTPYNDNAIRRRINALYDQGIPVVTLNTDIENSRRIAYVGSNYYRSGQTAAGLLRLMTSGQVYIGIISGSRNVLCHTERIAGFQSVMQQYDNVHISATITNQDDDFESYEMTARLLKEHPEINALYFAAGGVYGGCRAVIASGRQYDIKMFAYDMVETTKKLIEKGLIAATICQQPFLQGSKPLDILFTNLTTGESPQSEYNYVDLDIRIRENL